MNESPCAYEIIQETLQATGNSLSVSSLCSMAGVSRSGYYAWLKAAPIREAQEQRGREDFDLVLEAYRMRGYSKGAKGIYMALRTSSVADNLLRREFECYGPRMVLLTDITYLPYNGTFAYLSTILDAFTKQILSYALSPSLEVDFVLETVELLVKRHGISLHAETVIHSDQGCHYTSHKFINIVQDKGLRQSMSRKGNCWDNAPQESFFGHMKDHIKDRIAACPCYGDVKAVVDDYMDYYNNQRYQWRLAKLSPNEYYQFVTSGTYPLDVPNTPAPPAYEKQPEELGIHAAEKKTENN